VYKALHKASAVLHSTTTVTSAITANLQDRVNLLGYLAGIAYSAEVMGSLLRTVIVMIYSV